MGAKFKRTKFATYALKHVDSSKLFSFWTLHLGNIIISFLPPNVTSLVQPFDQGSFAPFEVQYTKKDFARGFFSAWFFSYSPRLEEYSAKCQARYCKLQYIVQVNFLVNPDSTTFEAKMSHNWKYDIWIIWHLLAQPNISYQLHVPNFPQSCQKHLTSISSTIVEDLKFF